jgi:hypothetical protein
LFDKAIAHNQDAPEAIVSNNGFDAIAELIQVISNQESTAQATEPIKSHISAL